MATQKEMSRHAEQQRFSVCRTFMDMQRSLHPLTPTEVDKLIEKRPDVYGVLKAWGARCQSK